MKGKVSKEILEQLKTEYQSGKQCPLFLYPTADGKHDFVFQAIDHQLNANIRRLESEAKEKGLELNKQEVDAMIFDRCVVWPVLMPEEVDALPVGLMSTLPKVIQEKSGFTEIDIRGNVLGPNISVIPITDPCTWGDYTAEDAAKIKENSPFQCVRLRMDSWIFIIRPMTRSDMLVSQTAVDNSLTLAKCVCMWPTEPNWDVVPAGYIDQIGNVALSISGWQTTDVEIVEL